MLRNKARKWTDEDDAVLRAMLEAGKSPAVVAARLKRTTEAVKDRAIIIKVSFKRKTPRITVPLPEAD